MLIVTGTNQHGNVLHLIMGPESDHWIDLHGAILTNITDVLNGLDSALPVFIHITRCRSEEYMAAEIEERSDIGETYPFRVPLHVFSQTKPAIAPPADSAEDAEPKATEPTKLIGICDSCGDAKSELVPKLYPAVCYRCIRLDRDLANQRRIIDFEDTEDSEDQEDE